MMAVTYRLDPRTVAYLAPPPFHRMLLKLTRKEEEEKKNDITIDMLQPCR